jgi:predicted nucleotidyltransferase
MKNLIDIIKSKKAIELLEYLVEHQDEEFHHNQLAKRIKISKNTLSKWLNHLLENDILAASSRGKLKLYKLRKDHPVFKQFKILLTLTKLWDACKKLKRRVEIYLYGSVALGQDDQASDVDILILGKIENEELLQLVEKMRKSLGREVKPLVLTPLEYSVLARKDRALYESIEESKIRVI